MTEENKQKFDEALLDKKKNCILPGGLFSKVKIYLIFHLISFFFLQVLDYVTYKEENSDTLEPLNPDACLFCFNNMETYRSEVIHSYSKIFFKRFLWEYESLNNGSAQYAQLDNPTYRVCIESSKNAG